MPDRENDPILDRIFAVEYLLGITVMASSNDPIQLNEVGAYDDLAARPNPDGLVILSVPPFEAMLPFIAQKMGRQLTPDEIDVERKKAPSIVLTKEAAEQMSAARAKRG